LLGDADVFYFCVNPPFETTFGATATSLDEAIVATVAWYRRNPEE